MELQNYNVQILKAVHIRPSVVLRTGAPAPARPSGFHSPTGKRSHHTPYGARRQRRASKNVRRNRLPALPARARLDRSTVIRLCRIPPLTRKCSLSVLSVSGLRRVRFCLWQHLSLAFRLHSDFLHRVFPACCAVAQSSRLSSGFIAHSTCIPIVLLMTTRTLHQPLFCAVLHGLKSF